MKSLRIAVLVAIVFIIAIQQIWTAEPKSPLTQDFRRGNVAGMLRESGLKFMTDQDGDFVISYDLSFKEKSIFQQVWVSSGLEKLSYTNSTLYILDVWSIAYITSNSLPSSCLKKLLERNSMVKIGAWSTTLVYRDGRLDNAIVLRVHMDARNITAESLAVVVEFTGTAAGCMKYEIETKGLSGIWSPRDGTPKPEFY